MEPLVLRQLLFHMAAPSPQGEIFRCLKAFSAVQDRDLNIIQAYSRFLHPASPTQSWLEPSLPEPQETGLLDTENLVRCTGNEARGKVVSSSHPGQGRELQ